MSAPGRRLAIDYGRKRIGLAVCDALGITARPLRVLESTTLERDLETLSRVVQDEEIAGLVVGIPFQLDGREGRAAAEVKLFAAVLRERLRLPVDEVDERLSTRAAHALLKDAGRRHAQRRGQVDGAAAVLILRSWLDQRRRSGGA